MLFCVLRKPMLFQYQITQDCEALYRNFFIKYWLHYVVCDFYGYIIMVFDHAGIQVSDLLIA